MGYLVAPFYRACELARRRGTIIISAGHIVSQTSVPALFDCVIGVAAGRFANPFDYRYRPKHGLECEALGYGQAVRTLSGGSAVVDGTSYAAPNITGIVALLLQRFPGADLRKVRQLLARFSVRSGEAG